MNRASLRALSVAVALTAMIGCRAQVPSVSELDRVETLWQSPDRTAVVALYVRPMNLSKNQDVLVCENRTEKFVVKVVPPKAFAAVQGNALVIFDQEKSTKPGWYTVTRNHGLNWFERTFGDAPLGTFEHAEQPRDFTTPVGTGVAGQVFAYRDGKLTRVADENGVQELWDVPAEGLLYVAPPGIGAKYTTILPGPCR